MPSSRTLLPLLLLFSPFSSATANHHKPLPLRKHHALVVPRQQAAGSVSLPTPSACSASCEPVSSSLTVCGGTDDTCLCEDSLLSGMKACLDCSKGVVAQGEVTQDQIDQADGAYQGLANHCAARSSTNSSSPRPILLNPASSTGAAAAGVSQTTSLPSTLLSNPSVTASAPPVASTLPTRLMLNPNAPAETSSSSSATIRSTSSSSSSSAAGGGATRAAEPTITGGGAVLGPNGHLIRPVEGGDASSGTETVDSAAVRQPSPIAWLAAAGAAMVAGWALA